MNPKHYRRILEDSIEKEESPDMEKMSRPRITFPGLPQVTTRPDQEVQSVETARQKELFGRKAVADIKDQTAPVYQSGNKIAERQVSRREEREKQAKRIAGKFDRRTLGMNVDTKHGPKSAAIAGKLRSKYEEGDSEYESKMAEHKQKRAAAIKEHNQKVDEWNKKAQEIRAKMQQASTPEERNTVMNEFHEHRAAAPKFKAPRAPSKKGKATTELSPEQASLRGKATEATIEHEGFHHIFDDIEHKYGPVAAANARKKILEQHNLDTLGEVGTFISTRLGYNPKSSHFSEEILAHSRDILVNPTKREAFKKFVGAEKADQHIKNLKQGHQKAYEAAKKLTIADIVPEQITQQPQKMAASELAKAPIENDDFVKLYHITDKAYFKLNPNYAPEDNAIAIQDRSGRKGIYTAPSVEEWVNGHGYARPFVAELHVPKSLLSDKSVGGRWGREKFIPAEHFNKVKVHRVIPIDAHARETYGSHGWFEGESGEEFDTGKPIATKEAYPFKGYQYGGKDARDMSLDEIKQIKQRFKRGYKARFGKSELAKAPIENYDSSIGREAPEHPMKERYEHSAKSTKVAPGIYHHAFFSNRNQEALHMLSNHSDPFYPKATIYSQLLGDTEKFSGAPLTVQLSQVHPEHKGKGHGKALYEFALAHHGELHSDELVSPQAEDVYAHLKGKGAQVQFGKPDTRERHKAKVMPGFSPSSAKLAANEKMGYSKKMEKVTLEHYSPVSGIKQIDPAHQGAGADARTKGRSSEHPHSFYYRKGTALPPEDAHIHQGAASRYEIDIPDDAKLYDLSTDPKNYIATLKQESLSRPVNPGVVSMDDIHGKLKGLGYHGFYASQHPSLSNVVGLYHSAPVSREEKLK